MEIDKISKEIFQTALDKGWWDFKTPRTFGDIIALIHSEASEALEEFRAGYPPQKLYYRYPSGETGLSPEDAGREPGKPEGVPSELADIIIRVLDYCEWAGIDIETAIRVKMDYNKTRSFHHGGKRL